MSTLLKITGQIKKNSGLKLFNYYLTIMSVLKYKQFKLLISELPFLDFGEISVIVPGS